MRISDWSSDVCSSDLQTVIRVILPAVLPAILTGFALAFARAAGEYGSIIFIAGNMPMVSEIAPLLIIIKLEEFDYAGARAVAVEMLRQSLILPLLINGMQSCTRKTHRGSPRDEYVTQPK